MCLVASLLILSSQFLLRHRSHFRVVCRIMCSVLTYANFYAEHQRRVAARLLSSLFGQERFIEFEQFLGLVRFLARPFLFTRTLLTRSPYSSPDTLPTHSRTCLRRLPSSRLPSSRPLLLAPYLAKKIRTPNEVRISCVVLYYPTISNLRSSMQRS